MDQDIGQLAMEKINKNLSPEALVAKALERKEGVVAGNGAFSVVTGSRTGRSTEDRFIVSDDITEKTIEWGSVNRPIEKEKFDALWERAVAYLAEKETFVSEMQVGADDKYALPIRVITELAWHQLFCHNMFVHEHKVDSQEDVWVLMNAPSLHTDSDRDGVHSDATLVIDFTQRRVLLCGLRYAGEMKKAMFSALNFLLPERNVLPMHCAANVGEAGDVALFFGLSGTGKTTLSADEGRFLMGDDEHGWGRDGVFNFEGGCYAKCINLSAEKEPVIYHAIREGAVMENVVLDNNTRMPNYADDRLSKNSRVAYPREHLQHFVLENSGGVPKAVIFLTCDLYGVLPPVAKLTRQQAAYHFLSGYTALVGSTEVGQEGIKPTFSTCFGAPFFPRPAQVYADLLLNRLEESDATVYLVNTGWTGGAHGEGGERFDIPVTRGIIRAILSGELKEAEYDVLPGFDLKIPRALPGVDSCLLNPRNTWADKAAYEKALHDLIEKFTKNFQRFKVASEIVKAGPQLDE